MYLKKLTTQGFKSFANRTSFEFGPGITTIVGPNGSGKSNFADALRWVLGEQSSRLLRARRQEDVIFAGGGQRPPVGMAEVILTLDNSDRWLPLDFEEIELGRRFYRNGESEYLLNGSRVRLRDVTELLTRGEVGQNSYTIMGQGLVDEVLLMSPEERRGFIDEAADVRRYRVRIKEAQDRLTATRTNLERVHLILREIEPRLTQLRRQADRAARQSDLTGELVATLKAYYTETWAETQNGLARARAALDQRSAENMAATDRVSHLREQLRTLGDEIRRRRESLSRVEGRNSALDESIADVERNLTLDRERHAMTIARRAELTAEIDSLQAEQQALASSDADDRDSDVELAERVDAARNRLADAQLALEESERDHANARARLREMSASLASDEERERRAEADMAGARRRMEELGREHEAVGSRRRALLVELIGYGRRYLTARSALRGAEAGVEAARLTADQSHERLARLEDEVRAFDTSRQNDIRELNHLEGRLEALSRVQAEHAGVAVGTRNTLVYGGVLPVDEHGTARELPGVVGLLARQIKVPAGLESAVNAALEYRLHAVVVEGEEQALAAIALLQARRGGRAMMLPLDGVRHVYPLNLSHERGVVGVAAKLVRCENRFRPLVDTLLGRVIIVEDTETGLRMVKRGLGSVVTLDGTFIEPNGVITGGLTGAEEGLFLRERELDELPAVISVLRERTANADARLVEARRSVEQAAREARQASAEYEHLMRRIGEARTEVERERDRFHRLRREMDAVMAKRADIGREQAACERTIAREGEAILATVREREARVAGRADAEQELTATAARREASLRDFAEASGALAAADGEQRTAVALRTQREHTLRRLAEQLGARRLQAATLEQDAATLGERAAAHAAALEALRYEREHQVDDTAPDRDELHRLESHERQVTDDLTNAQENLLGLERLRLDLEAEVARLSDHLEALRSEMAHEGLAPDRSGHIVAIEEAAGVTPWGIQGAAPLDLPATKARIEELRREIRRLGPVNEEAPEDFRELEERHAFLSGQVEDLEEAESQLRDVISELNEEIRSRFGVAFTKVNTAFGNYFTAFFGGGTASLLLTEPENLAETGIEIEAQPPGKRVRSLSLLSGGERSLTAVALLFGLLTVNPAPFCVLDEVDAALDEANIARFTGALKDLAGRTQFLVVTHNRRTIEQSNAIYGVSMGRDGVSKVLSVRLDDITEQGVVRTRRD